MEIRGLAIPTHTLLGIRDTAKAKVFYQMGLKPKNNGNFFALKALAWDILKERIQIHFHNSYEDTEALRRIYRKVENKWTDDLSPTNASNLFENSPPQTYGPPSSTAEEWLDANYWRMSKILSDTSSVTSFHSAREEVDTPPTEEIDLFAPLDDFEYELPPMNPDIHPTYNPTFEEEMPPPPSPDQLRVLSNARTSVFERLAPKVVETTLEEPRAITIATKRWSRGTLGHHPEKVAKVVSPSHVVSSSFTTIDPSDNLICTQQRLVTPPYISDRPVQVVKGNRFFRNEEDIIKYNRWYRNQSGGLRATPPPLQKVDIDEAFRQTPRHTDQPWFSPQQFPIKIEAYVQNDPFHDLPIDLTEDDD
jgi:hypothetical protein